MKHVIRTELILRLVVVVIGILGSGLGSSRAFAGAWNMESYGDSITAGFLDRTQLAPQPNLNLVNEAFNGVLFNADSLKRLMDNRLAWPSVLLRDFVRPEEGHLTNMAVSGALTQDLVSQVNALSAPDPQGHAFFFIGHNDLCNRSESPETLARIYYTQYHEALAAWDAKHVGGTADLLPIFDIPKVYDALHSYIWFKAGSKQYGCVTSWTFLFPYCPKNYDRYLEGTLASILEPQRDAMNAELGRLAQEWTQQSKNHNVYRYLKQPFTQELEPSFFAIDCYHPSAFGQKILAHGVYERMLSQESARSEN